MRERHAAQDRDSFQYLRSSVDHGMLQKQYRLLSDKIESVQHGRDDNLFQQKEFRSGSYVLVVGETREHVEQFKDAIQSKQVFSFRTLLSNVIKSS